MNVYPELRMMYVDDIKIHVWSKEQRVTRGHGESV